MLKKILPFFLIVILFSSSTYAFVFGLKSTNNSVDNLTEIEKTYNLFLPLVGFIYDPWDGQDVVAELEKMKTELGDQRIFHITVSPDQFSADEVAQGAFDQQYTLFFQTIKRLNLKVIFRTMHEMNGGWYPWGSNPETFKRAWIHVWNLSRSLGLDQNDILFDFSVNHWDMPTSEKPSQQAKLVQCKALEPFQKKINLLKKKKKPTAEEKDSLKKYEQQLKILKSCFRFEDYYPGNEFVDLVGVTFYNWGKATSNRQWLSPESILNDPERATLERLKKLGKPLFIDEVGTTAVWYPEAYSSSLSKAVFSSEQGDERKNIWLKQLSAFLQGNHFIGALYFNVDYTNGLQFPLVGEADWAIINPSLGKFYQGFWDLYGSSKSDFSSLLSLFGLISMKVNDKDRFVPLRSEKSIKLIESAVNAKILDPKEKSDFYDKLIKNPSNSKAFDKAVAILAEEYHFLQDEVATGTIK